MLTQAVNSNDLTTHDNELTTGHKTFDRAVSIPLNGEGGGKAEGLLPRDRQQNRFPIGRRGNLTYPRFVRSFVGVELDPYREE